MKRRVVLGAAGLVAGVVGVLVVLNWSTVRDHVDAWRFIRTVETTVIGPGPFPDKPPHPKELWFLMLANDSGLPVIYHRASLENNTRVEWKGGTVDQGIEAFREIGYRIVKQRFPRRALVVVGYPAVGRTESPSRLRGGGSTTLDVKASPR